MLTQADEKGLIKLSLEKKLHVARNESLKNNVSLWWSDGLKWTNDWMSERLLLLLWDASHLLRKTKQRRRRRRKCKTDSTDRSHLHTFYICPSVVISYKKPVAPKNFSFSLFLLPYCIKKDKPRNHQHARSVTWKKETGTDHRLQRKAARASQLALPKCTSPERRHRRRSR